MVLLTYRESSTILLASKLSRCDIKLAFWFGYQCSDSNFQCWIFGFDTHATVIKVDVEHIKRLSKRGDMCFRIKRCCLIDYNFSFTYFRSNLSYGRKQDHNNCWLTICGRFTISGQPHFSKVADQNINKMSSITTPFFEEYCPFVSLQFFRYPLQKSLPFTQFKILTWELSLPFAFN